jgi:hypothetical protein
MDEESTGNVPADGPSSTKSSQYQRTAEEIAWDAEFQATRSRSDPVAMVNDLAKLMVQVPVTIVQMPMRMLPNETAMHARAAVREGFLAVRSLFEAIGDGIEDVLSEASQRAGSRTVSGPQGTWGSSRQAAPSTTRSSRASRIRIEEETPAGEITIEETETGEGRGLRADIDY